METGDDLSRRSVWLIGADRNKKMLSSFIFKTCDTIVVIVFVKALPERTGTVEKAAAASSSSRKPALTFLPHFCFLSQLPKLMPAL